MSRPRKPYLHKETTRHGAVVWYVRVDKSQPRIRIKAVYGTKEFEKAYQAALRGDRLTPGRKASAGTLTWAIDLYKASSAWQRLSPATHKQRNGILKKIADSDAGKERLSDVTRETIVAGRERRKDTPAAARHFVDTMRGLFRWALESDLVAVDPTATVKTQAPKTTGHEPWSEEDLAAYEARWPLGTRERVALDVLRYTGLRRGDAVVVGRPHVKDGIIRMTTEKTGERVVIVMPPELIASLDAGPVGELTFIAGERGRPRIKEAFGEWFRSACRAAGVAKSAHGLRKIAATRDANDGYSERELEAKYGWTGGRMASHYTRSADRERLSIAAATRVLERKTGTLFPHPAKGAGNPRGKMP